MKIILFIVLMQLPLLVLAEGFQGMSEQDMQKMMQLAQKMEACMNKIDKTKLKQLEQRTNQLEVEIKTLCTNGKRAEAMAKANSFGNEIKNDPTLKALTKCGELSKGMMQGMMQGMMPAMPLMDQEKDSDKHVCDQ